MFTAQLGAAASVPVMQTHGPFMVSATRLVCAALLGIIWFRPRFVRLTGYQLKIIASLGLASAVTTTFFFAASTRIPVGAAATIDFLGPLSVAAYELKGWRRIILPLLAGAGVATMTFDGAGLLLDPTGVLFALVAACGWAAYILILKPAGALFPAQDVVVFSLMCAALAAMPIAAMIEPVTPIIPELPIIAGLAVLAPLLPFALEIAAIRCMQVGTFSILMSLEPAFGALLGLLVLGQTLSLQQIAGMCAVIAASIAAVAMAQN